MTPRPALASADLGPMHESRDVGQSLLGLAGGKQLKQKSHPCEISEKRKGPKVASLKGSTEVPLLFRTEDTDMSNSSYNAASEAGLYGREFSRALQRLATQVFTTLLEWEERTRQRRQLSELDTRMLKDIGLTQADVSREVEKPFWMP